MAERIEMKKFIEFLEKSDFIELIAEEGLWFIIEAGRKIPRNEISAYAKITSKGFDAIHENDKNRKSSLSFYLSIFFGLTSFVFASLNFMNAKDLESTQTKLNDARDSLVNAQLKYNKLQVQYNILDNVSKGK